MAYPFFVLKKSLKWSNTKISANHYLYLKKSMMKLLVNSEFLVPVIYS